MARAFGSRATLARKLRPRSSMRKSAGHSSIGLRHDRLSAGDDKAMKRPDAGARGSSMILRAMSALMVLTMSAASASATVTIYDASGGQIGGYLAKYEAIRDSGEPVVIDGACASACTLLLGVVPQNRICVTSRAVLEFH